jgi:hypothetical protein
MSISMKKERIVATKIFDESPCTDKYGDLELLPYGENQDESSIRFSSAMNGNPYQLFLGIA